MLLLPYLLRRAELDGWVCTNAGLASPGKVDWLSSWRGSRHRLQLCSAVPRTLPPAGCLLFLHKSRAGLTAQCPVACPFRPASAPLRMGCCLQIMPRMACAILSAGTGQAGTGAGSVPSSPSPTRVRACSCSPLPKFPTVWYAWAAIAIAIGSIRKSANSPASPPSYPPSPREGNCATSHRSPPQPTCFMPARGAAWDYTMRCSFSSPFPPFSLT